MIATSKQNKLQALIEETLAPTEYEVVLVEYKKAGKEWVLRVFIDHPNGIKLEHCQTVSHTITEMLLERDPIGSDYHIEVSSPGVDRPLVKPADFQRFAAERVFIKTRTAIDGTKKFTGTLLAGTEAEIEVENENDGKIYQIPFDEITKATLKPILKFD